MSDAFLEADTDICAREAIAVIEAVLGQRCPEMRSAYWTAVEKLYRLDSTPSRPDTAASGSSPEIPATEQGR